MKNLFLLVFLSSVLSAEIDCPNETARFVDLDSTSATFSDTVATGQCGCLGFSSSVAGTDTSVLVPILVYDNEALRGFQFTLRDNSNGALRFSWARTGNKVADWEVWGIEHADGSITVFGLDIEGGQTEPNSEKVLVEVMFDMAQTVPSRLSFHLDSTEDVILSDVDGDNVLCAYPDEQHPVNYEVNWLALHEQSELIPAQFALHQNFPNPFNPTTTFRFDLPGESEVQLAVYDMLGREVAFLVRENFPAGTHSVKWAGLNDKGIPVSNGIYYVKFVAGEFLETRKVTLLK